MAAAPGITWVSVNLKTGRPSSEPGARRLPFKVGTEPTAVRHGIDDEGVNPALFMGLP